MEELSVHDVDDGGNEGFDVFGAGDQGFNVVYNLRCQYAPRKLARRTTLTRAEVKKGVKILHSRLEIRVQILALNVLDRTVEFSWTHGFSDLKNPFVQVYRNKEYL